MNRPGRIVASALLLAVLAGGYVLTRSRSAALSGSASGPPTAGGPADVPQTSMVLIDRERAALAAETAVASLGTEAIANTPRPDELREVLSRSIESYWATKPDQMVAMLNSQGSPPPTALLDPQSAAEAWSHWTALFNGASFDRTRLSARTRIRDGKIIDVHEAFVFGPSDPIGLAVLGGMPPPLVVEILIPMQVSFEAGKVSTCRFGLQLAYDPRKLGWFLWRSAIYDFPSGTPLSGPPV